jgi:predicted DNA-binding protein (MmcQ/YjbR family)
LEKIENLNAALILRSMIHFENLRDLALSFPGTSESPHFEKTSFRVRKKIFATFDSANQRATLKLSEADQDMFSLHNPEAVYPVPNKWGKQGWTVFELSRVHPDLFRDALHTAYRLVAPAALVRQLKDGKKPDEFT